MSTCLRETNAQPMKTADQAAEYMCVSAACIRKWARNGIVRGSKMGTIWRFRQQWLDDAIEASSSKQSSAEIDVTSIVNNR